ncbi:MAG: 16S rRNA (guanine(527)-N(7))-methyltransferase RsmG [Muribaculaceae bacterium]|nr:16S rRNA (guanine(527)-N(7))-methyltransferase RsmG [Muribaculaceae bacterium]
METGTTDSVELISEYFPELSESQLVAFGKLEALYLDWNSKINVISRADTGGLYCRHVLHSLAIAKFLGPLTDGTRIMDLGTGGGFPGIPLAIFYPQCSFHLVDRIGKKIRVASAVAEAVGLRNVSFRHGDSGECHDKFGYVVSRAVMPLDGLVKACSRNIDVNSHASNRHAPGLVCLKGGDLADEIAAVRRPVLDIPVSDYFSEPFFATKEVVYVPFRKQ